MSHIRKIWRNYIWDEIQENRDNYYVEYHPLNLKNYYFAQLELVFINTPSIEKIVELMEVELNEWLTRFPLPLMVMAFDKTGDKISLSNLKPKNELIGFHDNEKNTIVKKWGNISKNEISSEILTDENIKEVYAGLTYIDIVEKEQYAKKKAIEMKQIKNFIDSTLAIWLFLSITIAYIGWQNYWVGALAFGYSLYRTIKRVLKLLGFKTIRKLEKDEKERKMKHYYYHCQKNPSGFAKLRADNFKKLDEEEILKTKDKLRNKTVR